MKRVTGSEPTPFYSRHGPHLLGDFGGVPNIVRINERNQFAFGNADTRVPRARDTAIERRDHTKPRFRNRIGIDDRNCVVSRPIINENDFQICVRLI
ncbi:hypothetical protein AX760_22405 [Pararhizobium antarcticum]|uniref:Uncharacterized protein n=1 Tax=Pararhizobium antarcticum TaxID=1798805 RepID=A0A657LP43_9HYPH|nr:hypothetical protein AX760_22405 [Pararhizobium antarcticum]OJF95825.1 hypothetical protein AX761_16950 [Rhizobium sp. 58]